MTLAQGVMLSVTVFAVFAAGYVAGWRDGLNELKQRVEDLERERNG